MVYLRRMFLPRLMPGLDSPLYLEDVPSCRKPSMLDRCLRPLNNNYRWCILFLRWSPLSFIALIYSIFFTFSFYFLSSSSFRSFSFYLYSSSLLASFWLSVSFKSSCILRWASFAHFSSSFYFSNFSSCSRTLWRIFNRSISAIDLVSLC